MYFFKKTIIGRNDNPEDPYLIRYTLFGCKWFTIKIHRILQSDFDCLHDHPWNFFSMILWGGYVEHRVIQVPCRMHEGVPEEYSEIMVDKTVSRIFHPGEVLYRKAGERHRLEIHQPCTTLVITFKKFRDWGFYTSKGWVNWRKYIPTSSCE